MKSKTPIWQIVLGILFLPLLAVMILAKLIRISE